MGWKNQKDKLDLILARLDPNRYTAATLFLAVVMLSSDTAMAATQRWTPTGGPEGGSIRALAMDPQNPATLYAGARVAGVFKSTDGGRGWSTVNTGIGNESVFALAIDLKNPSTIYAGTDGGGVFKSTDGGAGWSAVNTGLTSLSVLSLAIDPQNPATAYVGTVSGVFKSSNGGAVWSSVLKNDLTSLFAVHALAIDPQNPATVYVGLGIGSWVSKSSDGGTSWSPTSIGGVDGGISSLVIDPQNSKTLYAGTFYDGIFKSTDGGASWSAVNTGLTTLHIVTLAIDPEKPMTLYAGAAYGAGVFKSSNGGATWSAVNAGLTPEDTAVLALALEPRNPTTVYAGTGAGVFKSINGGASWSAVNTRLAGRSVGALAVNPKNPATLYAGTDYYGTVFKSSNGGYSWSGVRTRLLYSIEALAIDFLNPTNLYAGVYWGGVLKSTDGGQVWSETGLTSGGVHALAIDPQTSTTIYAGAESGVFKSTNGGESWTSVNSGLKSDNPYQAMIVYALAIDPQLPTTVYAGTVIGIFKSINGGQSWNATALTGTTVTSLAIDPQLPTTVYAGTGRGIFKSINGGQSWNATALTGVSVTSLAIDPQNSTTLYAGTFYDGIFKSTDGGSSWSGFNDGLTSKRVRALAVDPQDPTTVYAGTYGGGVFISSGMDQVSLALAAGGTVSTSTLGRSNELVSGFSAVAINTGSAPNGTAVIRYTQNGVVVSEVGVPASPPTASARFFVDSRTNVKSPGHPDAGTINVYTGFAAVNRGTGSANLDLKLRDPDGIVQAMGVFRLAQNAHIAKFLDQLGPDFVLPHGFVTQGLGSLEISSDQPLSVLALRLTHNQRGDLLLTTTPIADLSKPAASGSLAFPQIADGGGYNTTILLLNTSNALETGTIGFYGSTGAPLALRLASGGSPASQFPYSIKRGGFLRLVTDGTPADVNTGWALVTPDAGTATPVGAGVFSLIQGGILVSESGVPAATPTTHAHIHVDASGGHDTGIAVVNPGASPLRITATAYEADGIASAGSRPVTVDLPPLGHAAKFAGQFVAGLPKGFTGVLDLSSSDRFAALTLRSLYNERHDFLTTTFPVADADLAPPAPLVFPQIADGGGYQTQIILLSTSGAASALTVSYLGDDGSPLRVGKKPSKSP